MVEMGDLFVVEMGDLFVIEMGDLFVIEMGGPLWVRILIKMGSYIFE